MIDPNQSVQITLTIKRMYRERHEDTQAKEVGPGLVTVPRWVAAAWGIDAPEPIPVVEEDLEPATEPESEPETVAEFVEEMPEPEPEPIPDWEPSTATPKPKRKSTKKAS